MKKKISIYTVILMGLVISLASCNDYFDLRPQSETILEDFWETESDVSSAVGACYRGMNEEGFMKRIIAWGEVRSDNVIAGGNILANDDDAKALYRILNLSLTADNAYTYWGEVYSVINNCNNVIHYAPEVRKKDPNFTDIQLNTYLSEAVGIRALCYFMLIRTFRDIPLITEPTIDDSKSLEVPQAKPDSVLNFLIRDLKGVENIAMKTFKNNTAYDKGRITQKAIWALLADIYLWKNDYNNCIAYCNKILEDPDYRVDLVLEPSAVYNSTVYVTGNSKESIFELQFDPQNVWNNVIYKFYSYGNVANQSTTYLLSSFDFRQNGSGTLFASSDLRAKNAAFLDKMYTDGCFLMMKYVYLRNKTTNNISDYISTYGSNPNWIFYRLPDIYLMKAEALVENGALNEAYDWARKTYNRANPDKELPETPTVSGDADWMRNLVFDERQREFLFEGKRYFDLIRRINRQGSPTSIVNAYLIRKYMQLDQATVRTKLSDMDAIYMPINAGEMRLNPQLVQNPYYVGSKDIITN